MPSRLRVLALAASIGGMAVSVAHPSSATDKDIILSVPGIPGPYCAYGVEKRLLDLDGVERVVLSWQDERIRIVIADRSGVTRRQIRAAVKKADYPYEYSVEEP